MAEQDSEGEKRIQLKPVDGSKGQARREEDSYYTTEKICEDQRSVEVRLATENRGQAQWSQKGSERQLKIEGDSPCHKLQIKDVRWIMNKTS